MTEDYNLSWWPVAVLSFFVLLLVFLGLYNQHEMHTKTPLCKQEYGLGYRYTIDDGCIYDQNEYYKDNAKQLPRRKELLYCLEYK